MNLTLNEATAMVWVTGTQATDLGHFLEMDPNTKAIKVSVALCSVALPKTLPPNYHY